MSETNSKDQEKDPQVPERNQLIVYAIAGILALFPLLYATDWKLDDLLHLNRYHVTLDDRAFFVFLAVLPGFLGFVYHLVTVFGRRRQNRDQIAAYYAFRRGQSSAGEFEKNLQLPPEATRGPVSANAASALLTAVFLFVALFAGYNINAPGVHGMKFAGIGAYIAVLYVMVPRIYASALSSRFLMNSALRSASAIALGFVISLAGSALFPSQNLDTVAFLCGLFHIWAIDALRQRARKVFGQAEPAAVEVSISVVQGIDDTAADLLTEYGVTSVQHLATAEPGDLCERTLLPIDRVLDWIDQSLLILELGRLLCKVEPDQCECR